ncbi:MAG: nuclear transport factor 2 family protein, partial [Pseudomonadota bacterium]
SDEVINTVHAWANAWAKKDVAGYLAFYAKEFKTPKGEARGDWENSRKQRISAPKKIEIGIQSPKVILSGDNAASVTFRQYYRSDVIKASGTKTLVMVKTDGKWKIREERVN